VSGYHRAEGREELLLRRLKERQDALIMRVTRGGAPAENVASGYMYLVGSIVELDNVISIVEEVLLGKRAPEPTQDKPWDDYGVRS
jgi:hypothetical protein